MVFSLDTRSHSEIGLVRKNNQDSGFHSPNMLLVADGMGGAAAGDLASSVATQQISKVDSRQELDQAHELLAGALGRANDAIADLIDADPALDGMGTTVTAALFTGTQLAMAHIGDSRAYLLRGGRLHRLTHDHSWVQSLVDEGKITEADAAIHPHRSLLLRVLNGQSTHEPDLETVDLQLDDRLLFCSDGLCGFTTETEMARAMRDCTPEAAVAQLVQLAHRGGGADNITVVVSDVVPQSDELDALPGTTIGAAAEYTAPILEHHTLSGVEGLVLAPEPAAEAERFVTSPDQVPHLDEEVLRYAPRARSRRPVIATLALFTSIALLSAAALWGAWRYTQGQYYVGEDASRVAIFQGVPGNVFGKKLSHVAEAQSTLVDDLPAYYRQQVRSTIPVASLEAARTTTAELKVRAEQCIRIRAQRQTAPSAPASASASATASSTASPTASVGETTALPTQTPSQAVTALPTPSEGEC